MTGPKVHELEREIKRLRKIIRGYETSGYLPRSITQKYNSVEERLGMNNEATHKQFEYIFKYLGSDNEPQVLVGHEGWWFWRGQRDLVAYNPHRKLATQAADMERLRRSVLEIEATL